MPGAARYRHDAFSFQLSDGRRFDLIIHSINSKLAIGIGTPREGDGGSAEHASRGHVRADRGGARFVHLAPGGHGANSVGGLHVTPGEMLLNAGNVELHEAAAVLQELVDQREHAEELNGG